MTISRSHAEQLYSIDCWIKADPGEADPDEMLYSDDSDELVLEANSRIASRAFQFIELCEYRKGLPPDDWYRITRFTVPEQLPPQVE
jgi:hypothetical protein